MIVRELLEDDAELSSSADVGLELESSVIGLGLVL